MSPKAGDGIPVAGGGSSDADMSSGSAAAPMPRSTTEILEASALSAEKKAGLRWDTCTFASRGPMHGYFTHSGKYVPYGVFIYGLGHNAFIKNPPLDVNAEENDWILQSLLYCALEALKDVEGDVALHRRKMHPGQLKWWMHSLAAEVEEFKNYLIAHPHAIHLCRAAKN